MEPNLKEWLDRNARVVRDSGNAWYHLDHGAPVIRIDGDVPYVAIDRLIPRHGSPSTPVEGA